jgi:hypothetical protein
MSTETERMVADVKRKMVRACEKCVGKPIAVRSGRDIFRGTIVAARPAGSRWSRGGRSIVGIAEVTVELATGLRRNLLVSSLPR